jgi:hypothetical protein
VARRPRRARDDLQPQRLQAEEDLGVHQAAGMDGEQLHGRPFRVERSATAAGVRPPCDSAILDGTGILSPPGAPLPPGSSPGQAFPAGRAVARPLSRRGRATALPAGGANRSTLVGIRLRLHHVVERVALALDGARVLVADLVVVEGRAAGAVAGRIAEIPLGLAVPPGPRGLARRPLPIGLARAPRPSWRCSSVAAGPRPPRSNPRGGGAVPSRSGREAEGPLPSH